MSDVVKGLKGYLYRVIEISDYKPADGSQLLVLTQVDPRYLCELALGLSI